MRFIESRNSELKLKFSVNSYKTISAFANLDGGSIYIGVDDWGKVVGIDNVKKLKIDAENTINDTFMPKPVIDFITHDIEEKKVLELKVKKGNNPPYFYKNIAYTRIDTSTVEMDHSYLTKLMLSRENIGFDEVESSSNK